MQFVVNRAVLAATLPAMAVALTSTPHAEERAFDTQHYRIAVTTVAEGLVHPWGLDFLPDGRFLVTERDTGRMHVGSLEGGLAGEVEGMPEIFRYEGETPRSQAGLFDVAVHPDFAENALVYVSLAKPSERGAGTAIMRGRLVENAEEGSARLEDLETVFEMNEEDQDSSGVHFGGRLAFHPSDGSVFLTIGERRNVSRAQDPEDHAGSIIRVMEDGSVPQDNPFVGEDGKDDKIYAWGIRNSQALAFHPETGELWAVDHGPAGGDEINLIEAGNNYGWPFLTAGEDYSGAPIGVGTEHEGMTSAVHHFEETVAPSGLAFYRGDLFPKWEGDMLIGGLVSEALVRVRLENGEVVDEEWMLQDMGRRIRDVKIDDNGAVWVITEHEDGEVLRLAPASEPGPSERAEGRAN